MNYFKRGLIVALLFFTSSLYAKGLNIMGTDSRSTGLAGALAGETIGAEASFYNPAGFGFLQNQDFFFAYLYSKPYLKFTPDPNDELEEELSKNPQELSDNEKKIYYETLYRNAMRDKLIRSVNGNGVYRVNGFDLGVAVPFGAVFSEIKGLKDAGGFGLTLYSARFDNSIHLPIYTYDNPYYLNYSYRPLALDLNIGAGVNLGSIYSPLKGLSIGGGVNIFLNVFANIAAYLPHVPLPDEVKNLTDLESVGVTFMTDGYVDEPYALTPLAGIQYKVNDQLKLGFTYRSKFYLNVNADAFIRIRRLSTEREYFVPASVSLKVFYDPDQFCLGGSYKVTNNLEVLVEGDYNRWSEYIYPFLTARVKPRDIKDLIDDYLAVLGNPFPIQLTDTIFKPLTIGLSEKDTEKLKDTFTLRLGVEWKVGDRYIFDFGYYYDQNPVVSQSKSTNLLAADTHAFSFAFTYKILTNTFLSFHSQYQYLAETHYEKDSTYSEFYNKNNVLDPMKKLNRMYNPGYPGYTVGGGYLNIGLTITKRWGAAE